jgi:hypothetical protein
MRKPSTSSTRGKESGIVRFTFEMIEGLKIVEEDQSPDSQD